MATASQGHQDREDMEVEDDPAQMIDEEQVEKGVTILEAVHDGC